MKRTNQELKIIMKNEGYTQVQVAEAMDVSYRYFLQLLQRGEFSPRWRQRFFEGLGKLESESLDHKSRVMDWLNRSKDHDFSDYCRL